MFQPPAEDSLARRVSAAQDMINRDVFINVMSNRGLSNPADGFTKHKSDLASPLSISATGEFQAEGRRPPKKSMVRAPNLTI